MSVVTADFSQESAPEIKKPAALRPGALLSIAAPASPANEAKTSAGIAELQRLGFSLQHPAKLQPEGYFAAQHLQRFTELVRNLKDDQVRGIVALRGGYGSNYLLGDALSENIGDPKVFVGYSDITSLQIFLWQRLGWVTFYGPMVAAGFDGGVGAPNGYDEESFRMAVSQTDDGWEIPLRGEPLITGKASGHIVGGCMTLLEATLGTFWEVDTRDAILVLEDRAMKPYQVDRVLMHFQQAGKLQDVRGIVLGEFPECDAPAGSPAVRDVCARILAPLGVPVVFGVPIGHTPRPMLTLPLGVQARLQAKDEGVLEILEPAVVP